MANLIPKYTLWEAVNTAISVGMRALEEIRTLARTPGPQGEPGLGFDDLICEQVDDRNFKLKFARGKEVKEFPIFFPAMIYRDVFKDGETYQAGDTVTWGGCMWVARKDTVAKPGSNDEWRLAVKKGRDGKDVVSIPRDPAQPVSIKAAGNGSHNG